MSRSLRVSTRISILAQADAGCKWPRSHLLLDERHGSSPCCLSPRGGCPSCSPGQGPAAYGGGSGQRGSKGRLLGLPCPGAGTAEPPLGLPGTAVGAAMMEDAAPRSARGAAIRLARVARRQRKRARRALALAGADVGPEMQTLSLPIVSTRLRLRWRGWVRHRLPGLSLHLQGHRPASRPRSCGLWDCRLLWPAPGQPCLWLLRASRRLRVQLLRPRQAIPLCLGLALV